MGIFQKLSTVIRSNLNDLIARAENPEKMLNQVILDMRDQLTKAKQEVAVAIADERKLRAQVEEEHRQSQEWERRAMLAVKQDRDDLARQALLRHQEYAQRAQSLHETWQRQRADTEKLREALRQLEAKIQEAQRKKNLLVAKQRRAQAQRRIHETMSGLSDSSAFQAFERMADRIEENERLALASAEVSEMLGHETLEDEFKRLETGEGGDVENRLLALKQQMGILPAPAPEERRQLAGGDGGEEAEEEGAGAPVAADAAPHPSGDAVHDAELLEEFDALEEEEGRRGA